MQPSSGVLKRRHFSLAALAILALFASSSPFASVYGHGLGTDQTLPVTIAERQVAVEATLSPSFIPIPESARPELVIRALDADSNATIAGADYRVQVIFQNDTMLDQRFTSPDGIVRANLVPDNSIEGWQIAGHESATPEQQIEVSQSNPVEIRSGILAAGGLYHVIVTLERGTEGIPVQEDRKFDLYISIATSFPFEAETEQGGQEIVVKTYYDDVSNFSYDNRTIKFEMPFNWNPSYVNQVPVLHMEVQFPKSLPELQANSYRGTVNGLELHVGAVQIDDYSSEQSRLVHFVLSGSELGRLSNKMKAEDMNNAVFTLTPAETPKFPMDIVSLPAEKYVFQLAWDPATIRTGDIVTFTMNIQDPVTTDLIRRSSFDFVLTQDGAEIHRQRLSSDLGIYSHQFVFPRAGVVTLSASSINGESESARIDLRVLQGTGTPATLPPQQQPSGCLIATAAFGSELTPQVQYLRNFREQYILSTVSGSAFMSAFNSVYYSFSPQVADYERGQPWLQATVKTGLYPLFGILTAAERTHAAFGGEAGAILAGATASSLIGAVYLAPAGLAVSRKISGRWLAIVVAAAAAVMAITLVAAPALLAITTSAFVVASAGASAIAAAKAIRHVAHRLRNQRRYSDA